MNEETDNNEDENKDKKKKQLSMLLRVIVILGIVYLAADQFLSMNKDSVQETAVAPVKNKKSLNKKKPLDDGNEIKSNKTSEDSKMTNAPAESSPEVKKMEEQKTELKVEALPSVETFPTNTTIVKNEEVKVVEEKMTPEVQAPIENINITAKETKEVTAPSITIMPTETKELPVEKENLNEKKIDKSLDALIDEENKVNKQETTPVKKIQLEDKIVEDDVYVPPAPYDQLGRGLVYNCKEKYWACVDKAAYLICNKNMKWNKNHGKPAECAVQNVYNSEDDCNTIQKHNVSTGQLALSCD